MSFLALEQWRSTYICLPSCEKGERCSINTSISPGRNFLPHLRTFIKEQPGTKTFGSDRKWKSQIRIRRERHQVTIKGEDKTGGSQAWLARKHRDHHTWNATSSIKGCMELLLLYTDLKVEESSNAHGFVHRRWHSNNQCRKGWHPGFTAGSFNIRVHNHPQTPEPIHTWTQCKE